MTQSKKTWYGSFSIVKLSLFALLLAGGVGAAGTQCEALLGAALAACERYFPAFQYVLWAGKSAREALDAAMFETQGQA